MVQLYKEDQVQDLLGKLVREYYQHMKTKLDIDPEVLNEHMWDVQEFTDWARATLKATPVVGTYVAASGLGLRLQDGTSVPLTEQPPQRPMRDEAIHITNPGFNKATDLTMSAECMPITGKHN